MKVLFDTNVVLDLLLDRGPFARPAACLFSMVEKGRLEGLLAATTVTTIHYLATKAIGRKKAKTAVDKMLTLFRIAGVNHAVVSRAVERHWPDFEDALVHEAALQADAQAIVTRDTQGFKGSQISVLTPDECIRLLRVRDESNGPTA